MLRALPSYIISLFTSVGATFKIESTSTGGQNSAVSVGYELIILKEVREYYLVNNFRFNFSMCQLPTSSRLRGGEESFWNFSVSRNRQKSMQSSDSATSKTLEKYFQILKNVFFFANLAAILDFLARKVLIFFQEPQLLQFFI